MTVIELASFDIKIFVKVCFMLLQSRVMDQTYYVSIIILVIFMDKHYFSMNTKAEYFRNQSDNR